MRLDADAALLLIAGGHQVGFKLGRFGIGEHYAVARRRNVMDGGIYRALGRPLRNAFRHAYHWQLGRCLGEFFGNRRASREAGRGNGCNDRQGKTAAPRYAFIPRCGTALFQLSQPLGPGCPALKDDASSVK